MSTFHWVPGTQISAPAFKSRRQQLIVMQDGCIRKLVKIDDAPILIGNKPHCEIFLRDLLHQNVQMEIRLRDDVIVFRDLTMKGIARVDDVEVYEAVLVDGDVLCVGDYRIILDRPRNRDRNHGQSTLALLNPQHKPLDTDLPEELTGLNEIEDVVISEPAVAGSAEEIAETADNFHDAGAETIDEQEIDSDPQLSFIQSAAVSQETTKHYVWWSDMDFNDATEKVVPLHGRELAKLVEDMSANVETGELDAALLDIESEFSTDTISDNGNALPEDEVAIAPGRIDLEELCDALARAQDKDAHVVVSIAEQLDVPQRAVTQALAEMFLYEALDPKTFMACPPRFDLLAAPDARSRGCVLCMHKSRLTAVFSDPVDELLRGWIEGRISGSINWMMVTPDDLIGYIATHEQTMKAMDSAVQEAEFDSTTSVVQDLSLNSIHNDDNPVVKLVNSTLYDALKTNVSDIHLEATVDGLEIRYRIDGVLIPVASINGRKMSEQVISRIKVMSELDIAEQRIPQDGRFKTIFSGRQIDFRVSIMPSSFGEDGVLRILDKQSISKEVNGIDLAHLGFAPEMVDSIRQLSAKPYGMLLVTGPTGSGKTTTLYGALSESNSGSDKIVTIEDPVEYQLPGVLQIPVNEKKGLTFARGLRSILRHDPDKIMVGEIRDSETAQIAVQSALTGHLVFTTVHANNVFDVLSRFVHMDIEPFSLVAALNGILAQRLLRVNCPDCSAPIEPTPEMVEACGVTPAQARTFAWRAGTGCGTCRGTGFYGRKAVGELLILNDEMREAIVAKSSTRQLKALASKNGMHYLRDAAIQLLKDGETTIEEVNRVTAMA